MKGRKDERAKAKKRKSERTKKRKDERWTLGRQGDRRPSLGLRASLGLGLERSWTSLEKRKGKNETTKEQKRPGRSQDGPARKRAAPEGRSLAGASLYNPKHN